MRRRHYPRSVPPPVTSLRLAAVGRNAPKQPLEEWVPHVAHDKGVKLSRADRRALKEKQLSFDQQKLVDDCLGSVLPGLEVMRSAMWKAGLTPQYLEEGGGR